MWMAEQIAYRGLFVS